MMRTREEGSPGPEAPRPGKAMPDEEIEGAVEADSQAASSEHLQMLEENTPMATEPILADTLETVSAVLPEAISRISDGQLTAEVLVDGLDQVEKVPVSIAQWVMGVGGMVGELGAKVPALQAYAFDPMQALTTNDGLVQAVMQIDRLSRDAKALSGLQKAMAAPAPTAKPDAPAPAPTKEQP